MADGGGSGSIIIFIMIGIVAVYFLFFRKKRGSGGNSGAISTPPSGGGGGGTPTVTTGSGTIYPAKSHYAIANPAGQNENITYSSNGKAAISHRVDVNGTQDPAQEATVCLQWPANCTGGGHPQLVIKHWGPNHTDSSCCYAFGSAVLQGNSLQLGFGGEGPHPSTTTIQKLLLNIPFQTGKTYCFKSIIWPNAGGGAHQELYYDDTGTASNWKLAGKQDRATVGQNKTSTTIAPNAQVEFRIDCSNVTYSHTDVAAITPPAAGSAAVAYAHTKALTHAFDAVLSNITNNESDDCGCNPDDPGDCTGIPTRTVSSSALFSRIDLAGFS